MFPIVILYNRNMEITDKEERTGFKFSRRDLGRVLFASGVGMGLFAAGVEFTTETRKLFKDSHEAFLRKQFEKKEVRKTGAQFVRELVDTDRELTYKEFLTKIFGIYKKTSSTNNERTAFLDCISIVAALIYDRWGQKEVTELFDFKIPEDQTSNYLLWGVKPQGIYQALPKEAIFPGLDPLKHIFQNVFFSAFFINHENNAPPFIPEKFGGYVNPVFADWRDLDKYQKAYRQALYLSSMYEVATTFTVSGLGGKGGINSGFFDPKVKYDLHFNKIGASFGSGCMQALDKGYKIEETLDKITIS